METITHSQRRQNAEKALEAPREGALMHTMSDDNRRAIHNAFDLAIEAITHGVDGRVAIHMLAPVLQTLVTEDGSWGFVEDLLNEAEDEFTPA